MDSKRLARVLRAVLAGDFDFEARSHRPSSGFALFLAGVGTGVLVGMLFAPSSGEKLRSEIGDRTRDGFERAKSKAEEFAGRQKKTSSEAGPATAERNAS